MSTNGAGPLLELDAVDTYYGPIHILQGLSLVVRAGELVCLLGGNASGKSTTLKTVLGIVRPQRGAVRFEGEDVTERATSYRIAKGMAIVPENRRLFGPMTVMENLQMGAYLQRDRQAVRRGLDYVFATFPRLQERERQIAGTLSGGEQQMLAIGRALMSQPKFLMLDEPSLGLAPLLVKTIFEKIVEINRQQGITILLVEQNANLALEVSGYGYVLETGKVTLQGDSASLRQNPQVKSAYLGG